MPREPWVQVIGRVAVHPAEGEPARLTGSGQRLLSVLVAAGPSGTTAERIAEAIWGEAQPNPWRPALRMAVARLRKQMPQGWDLVGESGAYRIVKDRGWVDAWRLDEIASSQAPIDESDLAWMLAGEPFADVDMIDMAGAGPEHMQLLQIAVAERFCGQRPTSALIATCAALTSLLRSNPYNAQLATVIARAMAGAGRRAEVLAAVRSFADLYEADFGLVPADIRTFLDSDSSSTDVAGPGIDPAHAPSTATGVVPKELSHLVDGPIVGREPVLARLKAAQNALLIGPSGSGKSRLLAELVVSDIDRAITYIAGDERLDLALASFAVAIPEIRDELLAESDDLGTGGDDGSRDRAAATRAWRLVLDHFEARARDERQHVIVDDAHFLDSSSLGLLRLLVRSNTSAHIKITICGRNDIDDRSWSPFVVDAERSGVETVAIAGLSLEALERLAYLHFPATTHELRHGLAVDVLEASAGLPAVAGPLITSADPTTLALPEHLPGTTGLGRVTATVGARFPEIVGAAAVLGHQFSISALTALTDAAEDDVFECLDQLWVRGLIVETDDPDQLRFRHVLVQRSFLDRMPPFRRGQLHRRAAEIAIDPHERANHQASAGNLIPGEVAARSLIESARLYARNRQWRRVASQIRRADQITGHQLDPEALTVWAAALDRSGADGSAQRRAAYRQAAASADWAAALAAALSGLPEAELYDGDPERIEMLDAIDPQALSSTGRFERVLQLGRQYALRGERDAALACADEAIVLAATPDEIGLSHVTRWIATIYLQPLPHEFPEPVVEEGGLVVRTRIAQMTALGAAALGRDGDARVETDRFERLAAELGDPLRIWQAKTLRATFAFNDGLLDEAERMANENAEYAGLYGMQQAMSILAGQMVHLYGIRGKAGELWPLVESYRANMERSGLASSAMLICQHAAGAGDTEPELRRIVADALERPRTPSAIILAGLANMIADRAPDLIPAARAFLEPLSALSLYVGFGAGNLGPVERYLAQLATDPAERLDLARRAVATSDRHGALVWRVLNRLELALLEPGDHLADAARLATGTDLEQLVVTRGQALG